MSAITIPFHDASLLADSSSDAGTVKVNVARVWFRRALFVLATAICVVGLGWSVLASVGTRLGYQQLSVQTGSMSPAIKVGDLVVTRRVLPSKIKVGDIVTFREPTGSYLVFTHRVVAIEHSAGGPLLITKGDRNDHPDPWKVHYTADAWKLETTVPYAGNVFDWIHSPSGHRVVWASMFALVLLLLWPVIVGDDAELSDEVALEVSP